MKKGVCLLVLVSLFLTLQTFPQVFTEENLEYVYPTIETTSIQLNATAYRLESGNTVNLTFSFTNNKYVKYTLLQYLNYYGGSEKEAYVNATFYLDGVYGGYSYSDIGSGWGSRRSRSKSISFLLPGNHTIEWKWLFKVEEDGPGHLDIDFYGVKLILQMVLTATIDIDPNTLNLKSKGKWVTCYIELPEGYDPSSINRTSILFEDRLMHISQISVASFWVDKPLESVVGDYDCDGIPDLMVKFDRNSMVESLLSRYKLYGNVTWKVTGELNDGTLFEGSDTFQVKMHIKPPRGEEVRIVSITHNVLPDRRVRITVVTENCRYCGMSYQSYFGSRGGGGGGMRFVGDGTFESEIGPFLAGTEVSYMVSAASDNGTLVLSDMYAVQVGKVERSNITSLTISNVHHSPQNPTTNDTHFSIWADVTSNVSISEVESLYEGFGLNESGGGGGYMQKFNETTYAAQYLSLSNYEKVFYRVMAKDESNNTAVSPVFTFMIMQEEPLANSDILSVGNYLSEPNSASSFDVTSDNIAENKQMTTILENSVIPEFQSFLLLPLFMMVTLLTVVYVKKRKRNRD